MADGGAPQQKEQQGSSWGVSWLRDMQTDVPDSPYSKKILYHKEKHQCMLKWDAAITLAAL